MHFTSLRKPVDPFALMLVSTKSSQVLNFCYVKIKAGTDLKAAVGHINQSIHAIDPAYPVNVEFFDNVLNALYQGEIKLNRQITLFSLLAILISMIGVFGLVIFDTQYRRKGDRDPQGIRRDSRRNPHDVQQDLSLHCCRLLRNRRTGSVVRNKNSGCKISPTKPPSASGFFCRSAAGCTGCHDPHRHAAKLPCRH